MNKFDINGDNFNDDIDYNKETFEVAQNTILSYAETYKEETFSDHQETILSYARTYKKSYNETYNNYQEFTENQEIISSYAGITKRRRLETLSIPNAVLEETSQLYIEMTFKIEEKKLDKNDGVYKYVFKCQHARIFQPKKTAIDPSQQCNRESVKTDCTCYINICWPLRSPSPIVTKMNLEH
ncbi:3450_t:CDS:2 [Cetraspora pellucida]|uniref:3450_t:CDS:1 n=1 Tax=Cetraspora pellucida TaxID=1433469 RepID=A0ACA9LH66_9GLOM|nr:3450_t:CDS:2 [Cetraspora pellucida]